jgi:NTE family protein
MSKFVGNHQAQDLLRAILQKHFVAGNAEILETIESGAEYIDLDSGATLFREGELSDDMYFVLSGRLRAVSENGSGGRKIFGEIARGETIGELAFFTGQPRSASIVALRNSSLAKVTRAVVERAFTLSPQIAFSLMRIVIERQRRSEREYRPPNAPVNICMLPITSGLDPVDIANRLKSARPENQAPILVITANDIAARFGTSPPGDIWRSYGEVAGFIDEMEAQNSTILLVTDGQESEWTRFCLQHCDEILLLADAGRKPDISSVEASYFAGASPISIARQTLVLLHKPDLRSPTGTAQWLKVRNVERHFHIRPELPRDIRRLARVVSGHGIGIVLAGGGVKGFAHVGVIKALMEAGIEFDFVGGTSIGAIIGTCVALDLDAEGISNAVHRAFLGHPKGSITGDYNFIPLISLIRGRRASEAMAQFVRDTTNADVDTEDTWKTFFAIASNFSTGNEAVLCSGNLVRNVIASFAIPGALPPVFIDGNMMFDGGTFNNFPVDVMTGLGASRIIGVDLSTNQGRKFGVDRLPGVLALLRDKLRHRSKQRFGLPTVVETLITSSFIGSIAKQRTMRKFTHLLFQPRIPPVGLLEWKRYDDVVAAGYSHAKEVLAGLDDEKRKLFR